LCKGPHLTRYLRLPSAVYTRHACEDLDCIARRFDVTVDSILNRNKLTEEEANEVLGEGKQIYFPDEFEPFDGEHALLAHPAKYTVIEADETLFSFAGNFGDVTPEANADASDLDVGYNPPVSEVLDIP